ncbi:MAG: poly(R)-hydroxyalkanoic acid synthase subunit PhaE [Bacillus sp. (in: firmicutes)]
MSEKTTLDPFKIWKSMYDKTEAGLSDVLNETLKTEAFSEWLGQVQSGYLQYQKFIQNTTDEYLRQINVPTREEISNIATLIINVEEKLESLDEKFDEEISNETASLEIGKLKTSIARLDKKMDQILKSIEQIQIIATPATPVEQKKSLPAIEQNK